jgi:CheY-like chemotaxis protein
MGNKENGRWDKMIDVANSKLRQLFRLHRKEQLRSRDGTVLVVDDMPQQADMLREMLKLRGLDISVDLAKSFQEAMSYINEKGSEDIRIVVVDIRLGHNDNEDGLRLIHWMRENHPALPYIIMTGMSDKVDDFKHEVPGADIFVKGVADIDEFADAMGLVPMNGSNNIVRLPTDERVEQIF